MSHLEGNCDDINSTIEGFHKKSMHEIEQNYENLQQTQMNIYQEKTEETFRGMAHGQQTT